MHDTYASKPKPKPVNTSRLGNGNPNHTQPITANYTKLGFKPYQSTTSFVSTFFSLYLLQLLRVGHSTTSCWRLSHSSQFLSKHDLSFYFFFFFFGLVAFRILVPQPGTKLAPFAVEAWSPNHWTNREFPSPNIILRFVFLVFFNCFVFFFNYYFFTL